ncbi:hypothetical protein [Thiomonas sp.]
MFKPIAVVLLTLAVPALFPPLAEAAAATPQMIQSEIAHAQPQLAIRQLAPILKADPHSAKAWYLQAEALDASGNDQAAKQALSTAEHLNPGMWFANPKDLQRLEQRVGLTDVAAAKAQSRLLKTVDTILGILIGLGLIGFLVGRRRSTAEAAAAETARSDALVKLTEAMTGPFNQARISADAQGDTVRLALCNSLLVRVSNQASALKAAVSATTEDKREATERALKTLWQAQAQLDPAQPGAQAAATGLFSHSIPEATPAPAAPVGSPGVFAPNSGQPTYNGQGYPSAGNSGGGMLDTLITGAELGVGLQVGEDLIDGLLGGGREEGFGGGFDSGSGSDFDSGFGGGSDDGLAGGSDSFGGDGSDGGTDDGLSNDDDSGDFGGGADDGFDSGDSSW